MNNLKIDAIEKKIEKSDIAGEYLFGSLIIITILCTLYISMVIYKDNKQNQDLNLPQQESSNNPTSNPKLLSNLSSSITGFISVLFLFGHLFFLSSVGTSVYHTVVASVIDLIPLFLILCVEKVFLYVEKKIEDRFYWFFSALKWTAKYKIDARRPLPSAGLSSQKWS